MGVQGASHLVGGFVHGDTGAWAVDSAGGITQSGKFYITDAKPALRGSNFSSDDTGSYDLALKRWLPVRRAQVRSDGLAYAYAEPYKAKSSDALENATRIHVVSLVNKSDRVIYSGAPRGVMAYEREGIYVTAVSYYNGEGGSGLWRLDPTTGASTKIPNVDNGYVQAVGVGIAWTNGPAIQPHLLNSINLSSGSQQTWADTSDEGVLLFVGLDGSGHPLAVLYRFGVTETTPVLFVFTEPSVRVAIAKISFSRGVTDSHGTWLTGPDGIYLLDANDRLTKVSAVTGGTIAGGCN